MPYFSIWNFIELVTTVMLALHVCTASSTPGVVSLDDWTFDKVVDGSRHVLVKFDKKYPYGPLEMSYQAFVNDIRDTVLLTAEVGVQDFGDDQNNALKQRFKLDTETLPVYKLFVPHGGVKTFPGPVTADALRRWVAMQVDDIWIGLRGCLQEFDAIAATVNSSVPSDALSEAESMLKLIETSDVQRESAEYYVLILKKIVDLGISVVSQEHARVERLLLSRRMSPSKARDMEVRLNILTSFAQHLQNTTQA
eukprot:m.323885 g.323885  ORF g.323885 m.323885 type:complete len:252 (-) comp20363_c0_seq5:112-867(-)